MNPFVKLWRDERGLTLPELLGALVIAVLITTSLYGIFAAGLKTYQKIQVEGQLRDEADYIVARMMGELYSSDYDDVRYNQEEGSIAFYSLRKLSFYKDDLTYTYNDVPPAAKLYIKDGAIILEQDSGEKKEVLSSGDDSSILLLSPSSDMGLVCTRKENIFTSGAAPRTACKSGIVQLTLTFQKAKSAPLTVKSEIGF